MITTTYAAVLNLAAYLAGRADDTVAGSLRLPPSEAVLLRAFIAEELREVWNREAWPELCDHLEAVTLEADNCFDLREGEADEMGEILALIHGNDPRSTNAVTLLERHAWTRLEGRVNVLCPSGTLYVDWQTPVPDLLDADLTTEQLNAYELPARFKLPLAARAAALLIAEEDPAKASALRGLAELRLASEASKLTRPWWRK